MTVYRIREKRNGRYGVSTNVKCFVDYDEARSVFLGKVEGRKDNLADDRYDQNHMTCVETENRFYAKAIYNGCRGKEIEEYEYIFELHPNPEEYLEAKHLWNVFHEYDVDGGFGDAIPQRDLVGTAFASEYEVDQYLKKWDKPEVYEKPYASLYNHGISVERAEVSPSLEEIIPYSPAPRGWSEKGLSYAMEEVKETLSRISEAKESKSSLVLLKDLAEELEYDIDYLEDEIDEAESYSVEVDPAAKSSLEEAKKALEDLLGFIESKEVI